MNPAKLLDQVLETFRLHKDGSKIIADLSNRKVLHHSFEERYILKETNFEFIVTNVIERTDKLTEFYLDTLDGYPYKAEVIFEERWLLHSFRFWCQGCFGDDTSCGVCGGSGWGVL